MNPLSHQSRRDLSPQEVLKQIRCLERGDNIHVQMAASRVVAAGGPEADAICDILYTWIGDDVKDAGFASARACNIFSQALRDASPERRAVLKKRLRELHNDERHPYCESDVVQIIGTRAMHGEEHFSLPDFHAAMQANNGGLYILINQLSVAAEQSLNHGDFQGAETTVRRVCTELLTIIGRESENIEAQLAKAAALNAFRGLAAKEEFLPVLAGLILEEMQKTAPRQELYQGLLNLRCFLKESTKFDEACRELTEFSSVNPVLALVLNIPLSKEARAQKTPRFDAGLGFAEAE